MPNIDFPLNPTVGQKYMFAGVTYTFSAQGVWSPAGASIVTQSIPQGRLTLQSGVPVMTTSSTGHTAIYYTPYAGNRIPIWDGVNISMRRFDELTTTTVDFVNNPAALNANKLNDWFVWRDPSTGLLRLTHGPDWTDDLTRSAGTTLLRVEGLLVNNAQIGNGTTTGPAAQRGTYVGTTMSNASAQLDWIYGVRATPPIAGFFGVWNTYFRASVSSMLGDASNSWTYSLSTPRQINGQASAKMTFVSGLLEDTFVGFAFASANAVGGGVLITGCGYDSINQFSGSIGNIPNFSIWGSTSGRFATAAVGKHYMSHLEAVNSDGYPQNVFGGLFQGGQYTGMTFDGRF